MSRVVSALVLLPVVLGTVWYLPAYATLILAEVIAIAGFVEYRALAARLDAHVPFVITAISVGACCAAMAWPGARIDGTLMASTIAIGATALGSGAAGARTLRDVSAALFGILYLGLPLGALAAVRAESGAPVLLSLVLTVMASDTAQYYGGRAFGRRLLAPAISPKKTVAGAVCGFGAGMLAMVGLGAWALPVAPAAAMALLGLTVAALGIVGDLFESALKRGAGVKDTSAAIPGHGGILDRIDSLLFAGPVFYVFLRYLGA